LSLIIRYVEINQKIRDFCVVGSVENPEWRASVFRMPFPWECDEIMPSSEDMQFIADFVETVSYFNFFALIIINKNNIN